MRRKTTSSTVFMGLAQLVALSALGALSGCTDPMSILDSEDEKRRRDMATPGVDMADPARDMANPPMDMASPPMDMASPSMDMASPPGDMST